MAKKFIDSQKTRADKPDKIDNTRLLEDVRLHPDKLLRERAALFDVTVAGISVALKRLHIKKNAKI